MQLTFAYDPSWRFAFSTHPFKRLNPPALHITRFECGKHARKHPPYCVTIPIKQKFRTLEAELRTIVDDHQNRLNWGRLTSEQYYRLKGTLDMRMKVGQENIFVHILKKSFLVKFSELHSKIAFTKLKSRLSLEKAYYHTGQNDLSKGLKDKTIQDYSFICFVWV